jgi:multiple antibiotic resistance protein
MLIELGTKFLLAFSSLFVIVDPIGIVPTFLALTHNYSEAAARKIIYRACFIGAGVLVFFQLFGNLVFQSLHISLDAFKAAGGLLIFMTAFEMLKAKDSEEKYSPEVSEASEREDISIVPLAMPLLAGPGAITSVIVFSNESHASEYPWILSSLLSLAVIIVVFVLSYWILRSSHLIKRWLGKSGISVLQRVMGILLAAIAIQLVVEGIAPLVHRVLYPG